MPGTSFLEPNCRRIDLETTDRFTTAITGMAYELAGNGPVYFAEPEISDAFRYSQATQRYSLVVKSRGEQAPGPFDLSTSVDPSDATVPEAGSVATKYQITCTALKFHYITLSLFNPLGPNSSPLFSFARAGAYTQFYSGNASSAEVYYFPFAYGLATAAAGLNRTGTAVYQGDVQASGGDKFSITGTVKITVDFDHKTSATVLALKAQSTFDPNQPVVDLDELTFNQSGDLTRIGGTSDKGTIVGFLAGPAAEEAGISGRLTLSTTYNSQPVELKIVLSGAAKR